MDYYIKGFGFGVRYSRQKPQKLQTCCNQRVHRPPPRHLPPLARLLHATESCGNNPSCNKTGCVGDDSLMGDTDLQAWNALFTEAILAESLGLVDRPTALKGPDGQWQGVLTTITGERRAKATASNARPLMSSGGM